jgi:hypothetical protein
LSVICSSLSFLSRMSARGLGSSVRPYDAQPAIERPAMLSSLGSTARRGGQLAG